MNREDEAPFREFVAARTHDLFPTTYALTGDQDAAEDLLRFGLAALARRWPEVSADPERYVRLVICRAFVSPWHRLWHPRWHRRSRRTRRSGATGADLDSIPPRRRAVVVLRYLPERDDAGVAAILGCTPRTVAREHAAAMRSMGTPAAVFPADRPAVLR